ncbi:MAG: peptide ABC transporter substrate-binding protein [Chloroflexi bacterium]|nr:peptide ABC transporter substrate-binding protein [Chloroflexota bacterium]
MNRLILGVFGFMGVLVLAIGVLVIVLVVGGGDDGDNGDTGGGPRGESELRLLGPEPSDLDPHRAQDADSALYIVEIFGGLVTLDPDLNLQPDLAEEIPTEENGGKVVNEDGTVSYTFKIRRDALFHDRKPVNASVVKFSLERAADPATQSLVSEFFLGDIIGVKEKLRGEADEVSGVRVVDQFTIEITIEREITSFLFKLTYPTAYVVDEAQVGGNANWTRNPNGTGPYKLDEWRLGELIVLEANTRYHLGAPNIATIRYLLTGTGITLYERDEVDVTGVALDDLTRVQDTTDRLNAEYHSGERLSISYLGFNTNAPPFDDVKVRRAFAMAIDKDELVREVLNDAIPVANGLLMPGLKAYTEDAQDPPFDPERALELLAESKYGGPEGLPEITMAESGTGAASGPVTLVIQEMWLDHLGVDVGLQQSQSETFFQDVNEGRFQLFALGWIMDYPDEENLLNIHFDSESPNNDTFYENAEVDALLRQGLIEPLGPARNELYREAEQLILDDVPWFPLFFSRFHVLIKPYVNNYLIPAAVVPRLRFITLDTE